MKWGKYPKYKRPNEMVDRAVVTRIDTGEVVVLPYWATVNSRLEGAKAKAGDLFLLEVTGMGKAKKGQHAPYLTTLRRLKKGRG